MIFSANRSTKKSTHENKSRIVARCLGRSEKYWEWVLRDAFNKFPDFFVQAFKIAEDS